MTTHSLIVDGCRRAIAGPAQPPDRSLYGDVIGPE